MNSGLRSAFVAAALVACPFAGGGAAHAASALRPPSPLDARATPREGGAVSASAVALETLDAADPLRAHWDAFRARHGGAAAWSVYYDRATGLPAMVSGRGVPLLDEAGASSATLEQLDALVRAFLAGEAALPGPGRGALELDRAASVHVTPEHWLVVYRQSVDGVRVDDARIELHVVRGRLTLFGAALWAPPTVRGVPALDARAAAARIEAWLAGDAARLRFADAGALVLVPVAAENPTAARGAGVRHLLVWRFGFDEIGRPARWVGEVDAHDGRVRAFYESTQYGAVRGGVFPLSPDGDATRGGRELPGYPMPYADYTETAQPERFADDYAALTCSDPGAAVETNLAGPYVRIVDACGATAVQGSCGGLDLGTKAGENCAVAPGASPGNTSAARTSYYHLNRVAQVARFYDPSNAWLKGPVTTNVNVASSCNANWTGSVINMFSKGGNCNNMGENASVLVHEWAHGYDQNDGGGNDKPGEAYSDIVAILTTRDSCMSRGTYNDGSTCSGYGDACLTCTGFREFDWTRRASNTPATPTNFLQPHCPQDPSAYGGPCKKEAHCESYVSSEAIYDLATRDLPAAGVDPDSAWQLVDRLWFQTRPGSGGDGYTCSSLSTSNSCAATTWYQKMRVADDDDGNLANGTPHAAALYAAFARHKLACGAAADATNQSHSSCPALAAPAVTRTMTPAGVQLSWAPVAGAVTYRVFRGELGCNRQQVPLAALPATQTGYTDDSADSPVVRSYRVQAFGATAACASPVSACIAAPPGSRLEMKSHRVIDDGDGIPEPGETLNVPVTLFNGGADPALATNARMHLVSPPEARILGPDATWPAIAPNATAESAAPHFVVVMQGDAHCGDELALRVDGSASNAAPFTGTIRIPMGNPFVDYPEDAIVPIPYVTTAPVTATWNVTDDLVIADLDVTLDVFHQDPTQIVVELISPRGTRVRLHDRGPGIGHGVETRFDRDTAPSGPGTMADFIGEHTVGTWTVAVQDLDPSGITTDGYIRPSTLNVKIVGAFGCTPQTCPDPTPSTAPDLRVARAANGAAEDLVLTWTAAPGAGYHVLQATDRTFRSVDLIGTTTTATAWTIPDGVHTTPPVTFFEARAVNSCHQEGP